jgi:GNAT superfamily N-acetyltransferase
MARSDDRGLPAAIAARDGDVVEVLGRYEMFHQDRYKVLGPSGVTHWMCAVVVDGGGVVRIGGRSDEEREAMVGRIVKARGKLVVSPERAPAQVAQMEPAPTLVDAVVEPVGDVPLYDTVPRGTVGAEGKREIVEVLTTHLQMWGDHGPELAPAPDGVRVVRAAPPGVRFYRYLYDGVGSPWHWYDRKRWSDEQLAAVVNDPEVEVHVAWRDGVPAGYVELDRRVERECEVAYFGLFPEAIGGGLGTWLLRWAIREAWKQAEGMERLWVHTCTLDHPSALGVYEKCGFHAFGHERHRQYIVK